MQDRAFANPKIEYRWNSVVEEVQGDGRLQSIVLRDVETDTTNELPVSGMFVAIGHDPNTALFRGQLDLDEDGYVITQNGSTQTSVVGVFAGGDVQDRTYKQAITAAGSGCMAALEAEKYLEALGDRTIAG
jgi:thioredoxin reductase (NADPH)